MSATFITSSNKLEDNDQISDSTKNLIAFLCVLFFVFILVNLCILGKHLYQKMQQKIRANQTFELEEYMQTACRTENKNRSISDGYLRHKKNRNARFLRKRNGLKSQKNSNQYRLTKHSIPVWSRPLKLQRRLHSEKHKLLQNKITSVDEIEKYFDSLEKETQVKVRSILEVLLKDFRYNYTFEDLVRRPSYYGSADSTPSATKVALGLSPCCNSNQKQTTYFESTTKMTKSTSSTPGDAIAIPIVRLNNENIMKVQNEQEVRDLPICSTPKQIPNNAICTEFTTNDNITNNLSTPGYQKAYASWSPSAITNKSSALSPNTQWGQIENKGRKSR